MPPKKGAAKKGAKGKDLDDDAFWEKKGAGGSSIALTEGDDADADVAPVKAKGGKKSAFELLEEFEAGGGDDDEDGGGGGLLSAMRSRKDRKKPKKNAPSPTASDNDEPLPTPAPAAVATIDDEWPEEEVKPKKGGKKGGKQASGGKNKKGGKKIVEEQEEDEDDVEGYDLNDGGDMLMPVGEVGVISQPKVADVDEEWPEEELKPKKGGKKDKKKNKKQDDADFDMDEEPSPAPAPTAEETAAKKIEPTAESAAPAGAEDEDEDKEEEGGKLLSKKEKEKLKKEKEKAKKKAQAQKKKGVTGDGAEEKSVEQEPAPAAVAPEAAAEDDDEGDDDGGAGGDKKNKKKKKKKAAAPAVVEAPPAKKGKVNAQVAALQAALEKQRQMEAEIKAQQEAERLRVEEEEKRIAEEERLAEEAKQAKKEREKAKREIARKEGRLLTPKQKADKAAAEARKKALLASGFIVEGLQEGSTASTSAEKPKKVVYGNKKKPAAKKVENQAGPSQPPKEQAPSPSPEPDVAADASEASPAVEEDEDDWDKSDHEEVEKLTQAISQTKIADDEDDWDKDSEEEEAPPKKSAPTVNGSAKAAPKTSAPPAPKTNGKAAPVAKPATNGKPAGKAAAEESEDEDESDSEDDDDDDDSSDDDSSDDSDDDSDSSAELTPAQQKAAAELERRKAEAAGRRAQRHQEAMAARSKDDLRSPICCILGHVDTGKTKLLDKIRQTNVQGGEAGGITQQIGATYFPVDAIKTKTQVVNKDGLFDYKVPGLLIIDTPGHESFTNLRTRGSSLCNIAILVVDITHGLEPQTLESIRLLKERKTPFIVALNKIDRCYGWNPTPDGAFRESLEKQSASTKREFQNRLDATIVAFAEQGFNSVLFDENKDLGRQVSLVPTSAITGEGIPDMIMLLVKLTQQRMTDKLMYLSELECTVLEVKPIEGYGTTIDVILSNGVMREGDRIVVCGLNGPIVTNVRALLTPQPLRELRVKSAYVHNKEVKAALGVKIAAPGLEKAIAGSRLFVVGPDDDEDELMDEVMSDLKGLEEYVDKTGKGVWVQASTLGSLEALLEFLRSSKIPVMGVNIGPVYKRDIMKTAAMLEKAPEYAVVLCFDVTVEKEAKALADELNVKVFEAQIIYHLFDAFTAYMADVLETRRKDAAPNAVWPCRLKIIAAFAKRDPIVLGVDIIEGSLRVGTPVCVVRVDKATSKKEIIPLGKITSIEINHKTMDVVKKAQIGGGAAVKIEHASYQASKAYGRHFDDTDEIISHISRSSIDILKSTFKEQAEMSDWALIKALKPKLDIA